MQICKSLLIIIFIVSVINAQIKTNLEVVDSLIGKSIMEVDNSNIDKSNLFAIKFNSPENYRVLNNSIIEKLQNSGFILSEEKKEMNTINYSIENISVTYPEIFRDGIFGEYLVERNIDFEGSYFFSSEGKLGKVNNFLFNFSDTVALSDINSLQNIAYTFTSPEIPSEPFFSSLLEPTIAVGTAAIAVYLFFNIRSK